MGVPPGDKLVLVVESKGLPLYRNYYKYDKIVILFLIEYSSFRCHGSVFSVLRTCYLSSYFPLLMARVQFITYLLLLTIYYSVSVLVSVMVFL